MDDPELPLVERAIVATGCNWLAASLVKGSEKETNTSQGLD